MGEAAFLFCGPAQPQGSRIGSSELRQHSGPSLEHLSQLCSEPDSSWQMIIPPTL